MAAVVRIIIFALAAATLISTACGIPGTATHTSPILRNSSACYAGLEGKGTMVAAANGAACGQTYTVECTGPTKGSVPQPCRNGSITVTIVNRCVGGCGVNRFQLSEQAFSTIADPAAGRIRIEYNRIS